MHNGTITVQYVLVNEVEYTRWYSSIMIDHRIIPISIQPSQPRLVREFPCIHFASVIPTVQALPETKSAKESVVAPTNDLPYKFQSSDSRDFPTIKLAHSVLVKSCKLPLRRFPFRGVVRIPRSECDCPQ